MSPVFYVLIAAMLLMAGAGAGSGMSASFCRAGGFGRLRGGGAHQPL